MTTPLLRNDKRTIFGWAMYDWANSAYITAGSLIFSVYFAETIFPDAGVTLLGVNLDAESFFGFLVAIGAFLLFLVMPVLGAAADYSNSKRRLLQTFAYSGAIFAVLTAMPGAGSVTFAVIVALLAQIAFVAANVMYDGFLPEIASDDTIDKVSARGFAIGYLGGGLHLLLSLALLFFAEDIGVTEPTAQRIVIASAGLWWAAFGWFSFTRLRDVGETGELPAEYRTGLKAVGYTRLGFSRTWTTGRLLLGFKPLLLFVIAFIFYNDGVATAIKVTGVYASDTLGLSATIIAAVFVVIQAVAFVGALIFGWLAQAVGTKQAILISIGGWILVPIGGFLLPEGEAIPFLAVGALAGLVLGGVQALSRSLYASMIPEEASAEFFGFFSVFSKFSAIFGPALFALVNIMTGSARYAILFLAVFFVIGAVLLSRVDVDQARADRARWRFEGAEDEIDSGVGS
jgi:UMF1 family MFS transporter